MEPYHPAKLFYLRVSYGETMQSKNYYLSQKEDKEENRFYIYLHRRLSDNKVFYVGKGCGGRAWWFKGRNRRWTNTHRKHGTEFEIVYDDLIEEDAFLLEKETILEMSYHFQNTLTNMTIGGEGLSGYKWKDLTNHNWKRAKGTKRPVEIISKIVQTRKADRASSKVFTSMVKTLIGKRYVPLRFISEITGDPVSSLRRKVKSNVVITEETRAKMSQAAKGKVSPSRDLTIYSLTHKNGDTFSGTKFDFVDKVLGKPNDLLSLKRVWSVCSTKSKQYGQSAFGWTLTEVLNGK